MYVCVCVCVIMFRNIFYFTYQFDKLSTQTTQKGNKKAHIEINKTVSFTSSNMQATFADFSQRWLFALAQR